MAYRKVNDCQKNQEKDLRRLDELKLFCEETGRLPHQSGTSSEKALRQWADNAPRRKNPCNQCVLNELEKLKEKYAKSARSSVEMFEAYMDFCRQNSKSLVKNRLTRVRKVSQCILLGIGTLIC